MACLVPVDSVFCFCSVCLFKCLKVGAVLAQHSRQQFAQQVAVHVYLNHYMILLLSLTVTLLAMIPHVSQLQVNSQFFCSVAMLCSELHVLSAEQLQHFFSLYV